MAAVPIYVWNGTAWQETGPTIPASPIKYQASAPSSPSTGDIWVDSDGDVTTGSQQFQRFRFVASGGETTISGADANGAVLAYTAGLEQVVLNGAVLVRGHDYTATNGTSITGLSPALVASDVLEVFSFIAFTVANTYTQSQVDGLLADYAGLRLIVPTSATNGTVGATGAVTFSGVSSVSLNGCFTSTYENYLIKIEAINSASNGSSFRFRAAGTDVSSSNYYTQRVGIAAAATSFSRSSPSDRADISAYGAVETFWDINVYRPQLTATTYWSSKASAHDGTTVYLQDGAGFLNVTTACDAFTWIVGAGTMTGEIRVYGYKN